ncbi:MAG: spermidine/putrescine transport system permease protein [Saprospiraceae bacterium]|jgi:spermidine/putrescine transport system permease protein
MKQYWNQFFLKNGMGISLYLLIAAVIWLGMLILLPQIFMFDFSFRHNLPPAKLGGPEDVYTLSHYKFMAFGSEQATDSYNVVDVWVFVRTLVTAVCVTIFDLILCYPIAYYLAQVARGGWARLMVIALIIPYWVNELLRAFAFKIMLGTTGIINKFLLWVGIINTPIEFILQNYALYAGLSYAFILLMIFPIYNAIESLDKNQIEAARDLGAPWWRIHKRIVIPYAKPGITAGATMVFMLTAGALAAPQILGGPSSLWFTQIIYQWFNQGNNWQRGSAYAVFLLVSTIIIVLVVMKLFKVRMGEVTK